jgi:hypothetical protein
VTPAKRRAVSARTRAARRALRKRKDSESS